MGILVEHSKEWTKLYKSQSKLIKKTLGVKCTATYHIGATSIKDMPARPIIDILVALSDLGAAQKLREIGYEASDEGCFIKKEIGIAYTVRVVMRKDYQAAAHYLAIPQYLCENKQAAAEFAQKKRELATLSEQEYTIGSKQLLDEITPAALEYKRAADKRSTYMAIGMCLGAGIAEESRTHTPCGENFSRLMPNLALQDAYLASTRFDKIHQKIQRRRVLRSFARANISQMIRENAKQYKILRAFYLPQVQIFAAQNRVSSTLFGYRQRLHK